MASYLCPICHYGKELEGFLFGACGHGSCVDCATQMYPTSRTPCSMCRKPIGALHPVYLDLDLSTHSDKADLADLGDNPRAEEMVSARPFDSRHSQEEHILQLSQELLELSQENTFLRQEAGRVAIQHERIRELESQLLERTRRLDEATDTLEAASRAQQDIDTLRDRIRKLKGRLALKDTELSKEQLMSGRKDTQIKTLKSKLRELSRPMRRDQKEKAKDIDPDGMVEL